MTSRVPPGWPAAVPPPGGDRWERYAVEYLLDCCPPWFREYGLLRRQPVVLAMFAERFLEGQRRAAADGLAGIRVELDGAVPTAVVTEAVDVWQTEVARLARVRRSAWLLGRALRGEQFVPQLSGGAGRERRGPTPPDG